MARWRIRLAGLAAIAILVVAAERTAAAYPQWQLTSGAVRCNECHYGPGGGGLINSYGRDAIGDQLSTLGGDGRSCTERCRRPDGSLSEAMFAVPS